MEQTEKVHRSLKQMLFHNFLGGIAWGLGVTVGLSLLLAFVALVIKEINLVPIVGQFMSDVLMYMVKSNPNLQAH